MAHLHSRLEKLARSVQKVGHPCLSLFLTQHRQTQPLKACPHLN